MRNTVSIIFCGGDLMYRLLFRKRRYLSTFKHILKSKKYKCGNVRNLRELYQLMLSGYSRAGWGDGVEGEWKSPTVGQWRGGSLDPACYSAL